MDVFLSIFLGAIGVMQGAMNKVMSNHIGLTWSLLIGNFITLTASFIFFYIVKIYPEIFPNFVQLKNLNFKPWFLIPGILGFCIVLIFPYVIHKIGAVKTIVNVICAQMITSVLWDFFSKGPDITITKIIGVLLAFLSVILINFF